MIFAFAWCVLPKGERKDCQSWTGLALVSSLILSACSPLESDSAKAQAALGAPVAGNGCVENCGLFSQKVRAAYAYANATDEATVKRLTAQGMNALIVKGALSNNVKGDTLAGGLPQPVVELARLAKRDQFAFFPAINFVHRLFGAVCKNGADCSNISDQPVVFADGRVGTHVNPFDPAYWQNLTAIAVHLARAPMQDPLLRIDGLWVDFELYGAEDYGEPPYFNASWGFDDATFADFVATLPDDVVAHAPTLSSVRALRYSWLKEENLLDAYYLFLADRMEGFAREMRMAVKAVNPNFYLGAYPSPLSTRWYLAEIFAGWSTRNEPAIVWATEAYSRGGVSRFPRDLSASLLPEGYYDLSSIYAGTAKKPVSIYGHYIGGTVISFYFSENYGYHLYHMGEASNGYWIWTTHMLTTPYEQLTEDYQVPCYDGLTHIISSCTDGASYDRAAESYLEQIHRANTYLDLRMGDASFTPPLSLQSPKPFVFAPVRPPSFPIQVPDTLPRVPDQVVKASPSRFRGSHTFLFQGQAGESVHFNLLITPLGGTEILDGVTALILDQAGMEYDRRTFQAETETSHAFQWMPPKSGPFLLYIQSGTFSAVSFAGASVPVAAFLPPTESVPELHFVKASETDVVPLFFFMPPGTAPVTLSIRGAGVGEGVAARAYSPGLNGTFQEVASGSTNEVQTEFVLRLTPQSTQNQELWKVELSRPLTGGFEDFYIRFDSAIEPVIGFR